MAGEIPEGARPCTFCGYFYSHSEACPTRETWSLDYADTAVTIVGESETANEVTTPEYAVQFTALTDSKSKPWWKF